MLLFPTSYSAQSNKVDCVRPSRLALDKHRKSEKILDYCGNKQKAWMPIGIRPVALWCPRPDSNRYGVAPEGF